jgi:hypothetical protein
MTGREYNTQFSPEELATEIWKDIKGWEGFYQISSLGRVKSLERYKDSGNGLQKVYEKVLIPYKANKRYFIIGLSSESKTHAKYIHRLVLLTFIGYPKENQEACHNDGDISNNRVNNLRWDTRINNIKDKSKHGTQLQGESSPLAKLTEKDVIEIKRLYKTGSYYHRDLAVMFGVSRANICLIVNEVNWKHLKAKT